MTTYILAKRLTVMTLLAAFFAIGFSLVVTKAGGGGSQSHFGAMYACVSQDGAFCSNPGP